MCLNGHGNRWHILRPLMPSDLMQHPTRSQYEDFMRHVHTHGVFKADRTGTGTTSVFGYRCGLT